MYPYLDLRLNDASSGVKFVIWSMRGWVDAIARGTCPRHHLRGGFAMPQDEELFQAFHLFMTMIDTALRRRIGIRFLHCCCIGEDEALILAALSALAKNNSAPARAVFSDMLEPAGARHALITTKIFAMQLTKAGYALTPRNHASAQPPPDKTRKEG